MVHADRDLIHRVLILQDRAAYSDLVRKYQVTLRGYLLRLTQGQEWADDLAQETFLIGFRRLNQLKDPDRFQAWIYTIAHTQFLQWRRAHKTFENGEHQEVATENNPFAATEVGLLFKNLRPDERSALTLCLGHDLTHAEAADLLNLPLGTVKTLILRAREKIGALK